MCFSTWIRNVPATVSELECPRAVSSKRPVPRYGSFWAQSDESSPSSRHSQVTSNSKSQVSPGADLSDRIASAAEVCQTTTMKGVVNKNCDLEVDTLTDGKPVELIPQHRSDMVERPLVRDQPGCGVEDRLQSSHDNVCGTVKDTVTVIDTT